MEIAGPRPTRASSTVHQQAPWGHCDTGVDHTFEKNSRFTDWHVYGIVWNEAGIRCLIDGKTTRNLTFSSLPMGFYSAPQGPFNRNFHIVFNLAVGGNFGGIGDPVPAEFPWAMQIEWVRVYTAENDPWTVTGTVPGNLLHFYNN
jgi:beta-glucanase (GH16 family)